MNKEYELDYTDSFEQDVSTHKKSGDKSILKKIDSLLNELREHPLLIPQPQS
jgi:toxin YoeB